MSHQCHLSFYFWCHLQFPCMFGERKWDESPKLYSRHGYAPTQKVRAPRFFVPAWTYIAVKKLLNPGLDGSSKTSGERTSDPSTNTSHKRVLSTTVVLKYFFGGIWHISIPNYPRVYTPFCPVGMHTLSNRCCYHTNLFLHFVEIHSIHYLRAHITAKLILFLSNSFIFKCVWSEGT